MASTSRQMSVPHNVSFSGPSSAAHDVFLSFAGRDTRKMIVDPLCAALNEDGIRTFFNEREQEGEEISSQLIPAIEMSKIIIVVLSESYASSRGCLDELVQILESTSTEKQYVLPIFYDVHSADVSEQTGEFGTAFQKHTDMRKHDTWKSALNKIGCLLGFHLSTSQPGFDRKFMKIVEEVKRRISPFDDKAYKMELHLDFPFRHYLLYNVEEFLGVLKNHREYKDGNVAVRNLKTMDILNVELSQIPDNLSFPDLEELVLRPKHNLNWIPSSFFERMPALKTLHMSSMYVTNLMELGAPKSLKTLNLTCTNLIEISESFEFPPDLTIIDLKDCKSLIKIPESISKLKSLQNLYLSGCTSLAEIPESIGSAQSLTTLDLTDCKKLTELPDALSKLGSLQDLNISGCRTLESFKCPQGLTTLDLSNCRSLTKLPESINKLRFLKNLYLSGCSSLYELNKPGASIPCSWTSSDANRCIPSSFFKRMPGVEVLDISHTSIRTLPSWVCNLTKLKQLILQHCELPIKLPDRIDKLKNLVFLDLDGTDLVCLPKKLRKLTKLKRLNVSFYDSDCSRKGEEPVAVILAKILLELPQLEELSISFDPQNLWCSAEVESIIKDLPTLINLNALKLYLPTTELLQKFVKVARKDNESVFKKLKNFNLIIGPHAQRFIPRLPCDLEEEFLKLNKCVKYINGKGGTTEFAQALMHANALYLDCHWNIQKLSVFKLEELLQLKFCLLVDCNKMQTVFDGNDFQLTAPYTPVSLPPLDCNEIQTVSDESEFNPGVPNTGDNLLSLQYLAIHYLEKLEVIWRGPGVGCCSQSLKVLVLHMCPKLTTIFTLALPSDDLPNLEEIIVEECPEIETLIKVANSSQLTSKDIFPQLKRLSLVDLPKLVSITNGKSIGLKLKNVVIYGCPEFKTFPALGAENKEGIKIKGEHKWWTALGKDAPKCIFSELDTDEDFQDVLAAKYKNSLRFCKQPSELETDGDFLDELTRYNPVFISEIVEEDKLQISQFEDKADKSNPVFTSEIVEEDKLQISQYEDKADKMELHLDFPFRHYLLYNVEEFLGVLKNHREHKDGNVAVRNLKTMNILRHLRLSEIPDNLSFPDLEKLFLDEHLDLNSIPSSFFKRMPALKVLSMSYTNFIYLPPWVFTLIKLEKLILNHCQTLMKFPHEISALGSLTALDLRGCSDLVEIPESIEFPHSLSSLDLQDCTSLERLPESLSKLKFLKEIKLSGCSRLDEFKFQRLSLSRLSWDRQAGKTEVHIQHGDGYCSHLDSLREFLGLMKKVMKSKLLQTEFVAVKGVRRMDLTNPKVYEIPDNLSFPDLEELFLRSGDSNKDLSYIPSSFFKRTPCLKTLHMSSANITNLVELLHEISALKTITTLELNCCTNLIEFPESIEFPQDLITLDLSNCTSLTKIPQSISKLKSLRNFNLSGCCSLFEFNSPEVSIRSLSTSKDSSTMEIRLEWHKTKGTLFDITGLLGLVEKVRENKLLNWKFAKVREVKEIHIKNSELPTIPDDVNFPDLKKLVLQPNFDISCIPSSFFERMPGLEVLDMSHTRMKTLPSWVCNWTQLEELILQCCELPINITDTLIDKLKNLVLLDLDGTHLVCLPEKLSELTKLKRLKISFFDAESYSKSEETFAVILPKILLKLTQLEELSISFDPQDVWCSAAVKDIIMKVLPELINLETLKLYLPTTELLQNFMKLKRIDSEISVCRNLRDFNLIFGTPVPRSEFRLPFDFEEEFLKSKKCVKYINGKDETTEFAEVLKHTNALYLDCHRTIPKLSVFGLKELEELKFCLLVDCNEMQTVLDESDFNLGEVPNTGNNLLSLQYLAIHYLKNLKVIWKGPGADCRLRFLKVLVLHMCPDLTTIFTPALPNNLPYLVEIIVEDCPKIKTLIKVADSSQLASKDIFRQLKRLSLLKLPELEKITEGKSIGPLLENVVIYGCPELKTLPALGAENKEGIKIKGEHKWWTALGKDAPKCIFSELDTNEDFQDALAAKYKNSLRLWRQRL